MITYNDIYEAARKERYSDQLQGLPKNFLEEVASYLKDKKELSSKDDDFSDTVSKTKKQLENAKTLFRELIRKRRQKILNLVYIAAETGISKQDFENMLTFEKDLFEELMKCVELSDKKIERSLSGGSSESLNELILFSENVDEFLGFDGSKLGPFSKGQMANISKDVAKILVESSKAEFVEEV